MTQTIKDAEGKVIGELLKDEDITTNLDGKKLCVVGYASQGRGQSLCYRDSGVDTILGLRKDGASWKKAVEDGWKEGETLFEIKEAVSQADIVLLLIADTAQGECYKEAIEGNLKEGAMLVFSHGFNITYKQIVPPENIDVAMIAPKGPGATVRMQYEQGFGVPALLAVEQDASGDAWDKVLAMAKALGASRPGVYKTTFKEEVESDLFGEQVDLCGGVVEMVKHAYEVLIEAGYDPVMAYWEVHHELHGLIAPLAYKFGNVGMLNRVSLTARRGALTTGKRVMTDDVKKKMKESLDDIKSGKFADDWMNEYKEFGFKKMEDEMNELAKHDMETVGKQIREVMWPDEDAHQ